MYYKKNNISEGFDTFSPYKENMSYPFVYEKSLDQKSFNKTLEQWERPYNNNNEGYINAEPLGRPPFVPLTAYTDMKHTIFNYNTFLGENE